MSAPSGQCWTSVAGDGDIERTEVYGMPVTWTTHLWRPQQVTALLSQAGLQPVAELRLPPTAATTSAPAHRAQMVLASRRPS